MARPLQLFFVVSSLKATSLCAVLVPFNVTVKEGQNAILPCFFQPTCSNRSMLWVKNGKNVVKQNCSTDEGNKSADAQLSVSTDRNFGLNITRAEKQDEGDYFCEIQYEEKRWCVAIVRLKVNNTRSGSSSSSPALCVKNGKQNSTTDEGNTCADGRVSVSPERHLCPNVTWAKKQDEGDYLCYIQGEGKRCAAVLRLTVNGTSTPPPASKPQQT
uniref:limbic system-associated membrane protein n=1 Tax=Maylandia zebra TaxID=106582 RepID=UPI000D2FC627|nr:limbic system-associated membrane protein [Maylandia zebra]